MAPAPEALGEMMQDLAQPTYAHITDKDLWGFALYACVAVLLATPATLFANRRGVFAGFLAGLGTAAAVAVVGLASFTVLVMTYGGGVFGVGFAEAILLGLLGWVFAPIMLLGLVLAFVIRKLSRGRQAGVEP